MLESRGAEFHRMVTSTYDVHNTCNLRCEGCSYFVTDREAKPDAPSDAAYDRFFAAEAARGVTYPIFSGAEPSLNQKPLHIAARHWQSGAIFTNGIKRIDPGLPFRVVISVWGSERTARRLRGGNTYRKALKSAATDRRAMIFFTVTRESIEDLPAVVEDCAAQDVSVAFNLFTKSSEYARRLREGVENDSSYFRFSTETSNLALTADDRLRVAELIDASIDRFPETVLCTKPLNDFMCRAPAIHAVDPVSGLATNCGILNTTSHRSYNYDLTRDSRKECSAPDLDCSDCRVFGAALATRVLDKAAEFRTSKVAREEFRELRTLMMQLYYGQRESAHAQ